MYLLRACYRIDMPSFIAQPMSLSLCLHVEIFSKKRYIKVLIWLKSDKLRVSSSKKKEKLKTNFRVHSDGRLY